MLKVKGAQQIDYEQMKSLAFTVVCTDSGNPPRSLSAGFVISVKGNIIIIIMNSSLLLCAIFR